MLPSRLLFVLTLVASAVSGPALSAELLMYRRAGCPWCLAWDREIGPIYDKTSTGRRTPLRQLDLDQSRPDVVLKAPIIYTPTFVLIEEGREVARIEGYPGEHFFWGMLDNLARDLPSRHIDGLSTVPD